VAEQEEATLLPGTVYDTTFGYPALRLGDGPGVPADVFRLRTPARTLPVLDRYEGSEYRRIRIRLRDNRIGWVYAWGGTVDGMRPLPHGWPV
jgi:gamma-glutamylcyclotransferase (GGCT)/AIG2-like uncharacterized protein YtfP